MRWLLAVLVLAVASVQAESLLEAFGSGDNQFQIEFVSIGNPGNAADTTGSPAPAGGVAYIFNLGKFEISRSQIEKANLAGILGITMADMTLYGGNGLNRPATGITWYEAAKFVNYLNISQGKQAAYNFDSGGNFQLWGAGQYSGTNQYRHKDAYYFLPSTDEWYKGAYGSPSGTWYNFPSASDSSPMPISGGLLSGSAVYGQSIAAGPADVDYAGGLSSYGTMAQGGNVSEWTETSFDGSNNVANESREARGSFWNFFSDSLLSASSRGFNEPDAENSPMGSPLISNGFRVAMVPEPSLLSLLLAGGAVLMAGRRRK